MNLQTYLEKKANQQAGTTTPPAPRYVDNYPQMPISQAQLGAGRPNMKDIPAMPEPPPISDDKINGWLGLPGYLKQRKTSNNTLKERKTSPNINLPVPELPKEVTSPESYYMPTPPVPEPPHISDESLLRGAELMDRLNKRNPERQLEPIKQ